MLFYAFVHLKEIAVNAYDALATMIKDGPMDGQIFSDLVRDFRTGWLNQQNYAERVVFHRQPIVLKNEMLRKLSDYAQAIQSRPEMRCADLDDKGISYVPSVIKEITAQDKWICSLYDAIVAFCQWNKADVVTTAVHMAEYKAIDQLIRRFQRETMRTSKETQRAKAAPEAVLPTEAKKLEYNQQQINSSFFRFAEEHEALKKKFRIEAPISREEAAQHPRLVEGQLMSRNPEITDNPGKAFELFKNYYARVQFLYQKDYFYNKYRIWNEASISAEIQAIEDWMAGVRKLSYSEVCERKDFTSEQHEFLRLENGYYEGCRMTLDQCNENSTAARVYGRYFYFLKYLKDQLFDFIAARSNYQDVNGNLIPERLVRPEVQRRIEMETRARIATLPLENQYDYYRAILNTNITHKRDYLASGETGKDQIAIFDAEIDYASMEMGRIERARVNETTIISNMPKTYQLEVRESPREKYLKAFFQKGADLPSLQQHISDLDSVRTVNISNDNKDLTIYTAKAYDISEMEKEVASSLDAYFSGSSVDPKPANHVLTVSDKGYFDVLDHILAIGKEMESTLKLTQDWDEERYRDFIIAGLNRIYSGFRATGETYHRSGKTDILYADDAGNNLLVAECKLWKGEQYLSDAIDQLLSRYINWRDEKAAIILFNRDNKNFTNVIDKAVACLIAHPLCANYIGNRKDTSFSFSFRNANDANKLIKLELILLTFL